MRIKTLQQLLPEYSALESADLLITDLTDNSQRVTKGALFVARSGEVSCGLDYIEQAILAGAVAILADQDKAEDPRLKGLTVPVFTLANLNRQLGIVAARFFQCSSPIPVIAITGTNGKTSTAHFTAQALNKLGCHAALIGTLGNGFLDSLEAAVNTTPGAIELQRMIAQLTEQGASHLVMEVSSHALEQHRVSGLSFAVAAFSNLSRDHLDYHQNMEAYGAAKEKLFSEHHPEVSVFNLDDAFGCYLAERYSSEKSIKVGRHIGSIQLIDSDRFSEGFCSLSVDGEEVQLSTKVRGDFNLDNLLLVAGILGALAFDQKSIAIALNDLSPVPGRMEHIPSVAGPQVFVDYAHTPDGLEKALEAVHPSEGGKKICVFGCGGDRDHGKRSLMGAVAARLADQVVITNDNPRTEDPMQIVEMIKQGCQEGGKVQVVMDRRLAIVKAVAEAEPSDTLLIAGKGDEDYQIIGSQRLPFSDRLVAAEALKEFWG